ncbi:hypothetical protein [Thermococcus sp.]|uniref:hypothetical protein n=1 Tax=Thermococcus sp. TaxID=35749 RepID=UPI0026348229|nr:hypothetical protein [Thermococcus sp.]
MDMETYEILRAVASLERKSLKEVLRSIIRDYAKKEKEKILSELHHDPLWKSIGLLDMDEEDLSERDDWGVVEWKASEARADIPRHKRTDSTLQLKG